MTLILILTLAACGRIGFDAGDDAGIDGSSGVPRCGGVELLTDDFETATISVDRWPRRYSNPGTVLDQVAGRLRFQLATQEPTPAYAGVDTAHTYDLREAEVIAQVAGIPNPTAMSAEMMFQVRDNDQARVEVVIRAGQIRLRVLDPQPSSSAAIAFDMSLHRFLRLRHTEDGLVHGDTSGDGTTWSTLGSFRAPFDPAFARIGLVAGTYAAEATPGTALWEGLNVGRSPSMRFCPIDSIRDDFEDGIDIPWYLDEGATTCREVGGRLELAPPSGAPNGCSVKSRPFWDLDGRAISVRVPRVTAPFPGGTTGFEVGPTQTERVKILKKDADLEFRVVTATTDVQVAVATYDAAVHRWWRIKHDAGQLVAETSDGAGPWSVLGSVLAPFQVSAVEVEFGVLTSGDPSAGLAQFDDVNGR